MKALSLRRPSGQIPTGEAYGPCKAAFVWHPSSANCERYPGCRGPDFVILQSTKKDAQCNTPHQCVSNFHLLGSTSEACLPFPAVPQHIASPGTYMQASTRISAVTAAKLGGGAALGFLNSCRPGVQVTVKAQAAELSGDLGKDAYTLRYSSPRTCLNLLAQADFAELKTHACH